MKIKVLEIIGKDAFLIKANELSSSVAYYINRNMIHPELKNKGMTFKKDDVIEILPSFKEIIGYKKEDILLSVEDFKSKRTYYDSDSTEEETLRAIANRKEIEGFEPIYKEIDFEKVELDVYGNIHDTNSNFIHCGITDRWNNKPLVYTLNQNAIAVDEYNKLKNKYSTHAKFDKLDRNYIEYAQINGNYVFTNSNMFSEKRNDKLFQSLDDAITEEKLIRDAINRIVKNRIFPENIDPNKRLMILGHLRAIKKAKSKNVMDEMLQILIEDIQDYIKEIVFKNN